MGCGSSKSTENVSDDTNTAPKVEKETRNKETDNKDKNEENTDIDKAGLLTFREQCLEVHNKLRAKHGVEPLVLADDINDMAQKYAEYLGKNNKFDHSEKDDRKGCGENLAGCTCKAGSFPEGEYITNMWYDEIKDYDFSNPGFKMGTGHFTQVVWKGTKELGVGIGYQKNGMCVVVANYRPAGNMMGDFPDNVPNLL